MRGATGGSGGQGWLLPAPDAAGTRSAHAAAREARESLLGRGGRIRALLLWRRNASSRLGNSSPIASIRTRSSATGTSMLLGGSVGCGRCGCCSVCLLSPLFHSLSLSLSLPFSLSLSLPFSLSLSLFGGQLQDLRGASGGLNGVSQQDVVQRGVMRHRGVGKIF